MDYNLLNGGLVLKIGENLIVSSLKNYKTVFKSEADGMFWFMNFDGKNVYYSDQRRNNSLCSMDIERQKEDLILDKPCYGLLSNNDMLYYINENDRQVYRCSKGGKSETKIIDEQVNCFILEDESFFYATSQGIRTCSEAGSNRETVNDVLASTLILLNGKLIFTDTSKQHVLSILDLNTNSTQIITGIASASINTDGRYLYCANRLNDRSIYRVDPISQVSIRICGESAEYLHVIENELYFCINHEWHRMSLTGGHFEKIAGENE